MRVRSASAAAPRPNAKLKSKMLEVWNSEFPTTLLFFIVYFYLATGSERYKLFCSHSSSHVEVVEKYSRRTWAEFGCNWLEFVTWSVF